MKVVKKIRESLQARKLEKLVGNGEVGSKELSAPAIHREAHEQHRLGSCTVTVMQQGLGGKKELDARLIALLGKIYGKQFEKISDDERTNARKVLESKIEYAKNPNQQALWAAQLDELDKILKETGG